MLRAARVRRKSSKYCSDYCEGYAITRLYVWAYGLQGAAFALNSKNRRIDNSKLRKWPTEKVRGPNWPKTQKNPSSLVPNGCKKPRRRAEGRSDRSRHHRGGCRSSSICLRWAGGEIAPDQAETLSGLREIRRRAVESIEFEQRLAALERRTVDQLRSGNGVCAASRMAPPTTKICRSSIFRRSVKSMVAWKMAGRRKRKAMPQSSGYGNVNNRLRGSSNYVMIWTGGNNKAKRIAYNIRTRLARLEDNNSSRPAPAFMPMAEFTLGLWQV